MALSTNNYFDDRVRLLFVTGILGSFTTMSTYSLESIILWKNNRFMCFIYIFSTAVFGPICALLGFEIINKDGVKILGDSNILNKLPTSASNLYAKNVFNFVTNLYDKEKKRINVNLEDEIIEKTLIK